MHILTREMVELAQRLRRRLRAAGHDVPALSDRDLIERLLAITADSRVPGLAADAARLSELASPPAAGEPDAPGSAPGRVYRGAPLPPEPPRDKERSAPAQPPGSGAQRPPRRFYRGVPLDDE